MTTKHITNELADEIKKERASENVSPVQARWLFKFEKMLRQQQARITELETYDGTSYVIKRQQAEIEALKTDNLKYKEWSEYTEKKADEFYDELEALKAKTLTDEEAYEIFSKAACGNGYDFKAGVRAVLKKASEK